MQQPIKSTCIIQLNTEGKIVIIYRTFSIQHTEADKMATISQNHIFKCIFLNENVRISIKMSLKFVPKGPIDNMPALVQIMAWCQTGNKPLSEPKVAKVTDTNMRHSASMSWIQLETALGAFVSAAYVMIKTKLWLE